MNNLRTRKFVKLAKHALDVASLRETQQAVNALLNGRVVIGQDNKIHYSDSNLVIEINPGGATQDFQLISDGGDWYNCKAFDGKNVSGPIVKVAKNQDLRCILASATPAGGAWASKVIRGITYTYTYNVIAGATIDGVNVVEYTRTVAGSDSSSATSYVTPCLNCINAGSSPAGAGDIITAYQTTFAGPATLVSVTWQALADGRAWADAPS